MSTGEPTCSPKNPGGHADDGHPLRADLDALAEHRRIACEPARPETVADHRDRAIRPAACRLRIVRGRQHPAVDRADAEQLEVGARGVLAAHALGHAIDRHLEQALVEGGDPREEAVVIADAFEAG